MPGKICASAANVCFSKFDEVRVHALRVAALAVDVKLSSAFIGAEYCDTRVADLIEFSPSVVSGQAVWFRTLQMPPGLSKDMREWSDSGLL